MNPKPLYTHKKKVAACLATVCVCLGAAWFYFPRQLPRPDAFYLITKAMTQAEVEALVGGPPGDYGNYGVGWHNNGFMTAEAFLAPEGSIEKCWWDDTQRFEVWFDSNNRVVGVHKRAYCQAGPREWLPEDLRRWLVDLWRNL
jgi:hypothetical protein